MPNSSIPAQTNLVDIGYLQIQTLSEENQFPIENARIAISYTGQPDSVIETLETDSSGQTENIALEAPPLEYSETPGSPQPYSEYTLSITAPGFEPLTISGTEILPTANAIQVARLRPLEDATGDSENVVIGPHTLYYQYPPKIAEAEIKPIRDTGSIVLSKVVVPEFIVVHDGVPTDTSAQNYYVPFRDYIKNVASSEIYATWPRTTITANVLAILSFTLNRVYTEWYRNQGYNFTITSSTAYDHKWIFERNIYESISVIVDEIFNNYLSRPDVKQPILTQYCDGRNTQCPGWLTRLQKRMHKKQPSFWRIFCLLRAVSMCLSLTSCLCYAILKLEGETGRRLTLSNCITCLYSRPAVITANNGGYFLSLKIL